MTTRPRTRRQEQRELAAQLRGAGRTWVELAKAFAERYGVNMRVALRLAHGWSQREAADAWNHRWPTSPKTFKNFSYWELWPASTGHAPSMEVLARLAELYECSVADLVADGPRFDQRDSAVVARRHVADLPIPVTVDVGLPTSVEDASADGSPAVSLESVERLAALAGRIGEMDVGQLAQRFAAWARLVDPTIGRRGLMLKISAGLALAAGHASLADEPSPGVEPAADSQDAALSGVWHSRYHYHSTGRDDEFEGQHYVVLRHQGGRLVGQSLPHSTGRLELDLSLDGSIATGTWTERTSATSYYRGAVYHGAIQLVVNPTGRAMKGKWLGFGKEFEINTGDWELTWVDGETSPRALREYRLEP